jgi:hypothetical protein
LARLFGACLFAGCLLAIYFAVRQGIGAWYFRQNEPEAVQAATKWDPGNGRYADTLAELAHFYSANPDPNQIVQLCARAVQLSPYDAHYWADLGSAYDWAGRTDDALGAFERARRLAPNSPDINWRLANLYVRANRPSRALPLLKTVLAARAVDDKQVFELASRSGVDNDSMMAEMLPVDGSIFVDYLDYQLSSGQIDRAGEAWTRLLRSGLRFKISDVFPYFDALVRAKKVDAASEVWNDLIGRFPAELRARSSAGNLIADGGFELPILDGGFDWRVNPVKGAAVRIEPGERTHGNGWLRIDFDGTENLDYGEVLQLVAVKPSTRYAFSAEVRAQGITTDSGPRFQLFDTYDMKDLFVGLGNTVGTKDWSPERLNFQTGPRTRLLWVRVARPASQKFDNKIAGTFWVRRISLTARPSGAAPNTSSPSSRP